MNNRTVQLCNLQYPLLRYSELEVSSLFHFLDGNKNYSIPKGELSIAFVDDKNISQLHQDFLSDASTTDVITFPGDALLDFAGEICVNCDLAIRVADQYNHTFAEELSLYLIHGWLHLAGFNDHEEKDIAAMRAAEKNVMNSITESQLLPNFFVHGI